MNLGQLVGYLLLSGAIGVLVKTPAKSEEISSIRVHKSPASTIDSVSFTQQVRLVTEARQAKPITEIRRLSQIKHPAEDAQMLLVQSPAQVTAPTSLRTSSISNIKIRIAT